MFIRFGRNIKVLYNLTDCNLMHFGLCAYLKFTVIPSG